MEDEDSRTVWVGNFDPDDTTEETLFELFLQAGPLHYVKIPKDRATGKTKNFGFIIYRHSVSVPYAIELLNGVAVYGRYLKVQSRNHPHLQQQHHFSAGGVHSLDPDFGKVQNYSGPSQHFGQQALMLGTPSLLGMPNNAVMSMAQQQMSLLNAYQPIPLAANPLLNAPRERYSDRQGTLGYGRNNPYQRDNYASNNAYQRNNYANNDYRKYSQSHHQAASFNPYSNSNSKDKYGMAADMHHQGHFDYNRLGAPPSRGHHHSAHGNDSNSRQGDRQDRHRNLEKAVEDGGANGGVGRNVSETIEHFLLQCPRFHSHRVVHVVLRSQLLTLNVVTCDLPTLLAVAGVHPSQQHGVIRLTCAFLRKTGQLQCL
ncbi:RNA-binding protein 7 [Chionoecetes opilio]|uniref:RNA-binding protein 7 n=1 Tax=Chionoecetes opilio TaxID=41210 RepID=A0A8J8WFP5_CHIOP|nr:RNA-binding protein 7 [Chionoecetes opilio]